MQAAIFGGDIEMYADAIKINGEYEIGNAPIKPVPPEFREQAGDYQMNFSGKVHVKPLDLSGCSDEPQYRTLSLVPHTYSVGDALVGN